MDIYIANSTRQAMRIWLRVAEMDGSNRLRRVNITPGGQEVVKGLSKGQADLVVAQLRTYGALRREEISRSIKRFDGIVFAFDNPISENAIQHGHAEQIDYAQQRAVEENTRTALSSDRDPGTRKRKSRETSFEISRDGERGGSTPVMGLTISETGANTKSLPI